MDYKQIIQRIREPKSALFIPILILAVVLIASVALQKGGFSEIDKTYWIRVNEGEAIPTTMNSSMYSVRKIESKDLGVISTIVAISDRAIKSGFKQGDMNFYGNVVDGKIIGFVHYIGTHGNCSISFFSPMEIILPEQFIDGDTTLAGSDLVPQIDIESCRVFPREYWPKRNFTLIQVEFSE